MPSFSYIAKTLKGETVAKVVEAKDKYILARQLRQKGEILISAVSEEEKASKKKIRLANLIEMGRVSVVEKMMFTRNLRVMIKAGVALPKALRLLAEQSKSRKFKNALLDTVDEITKGRAFSESLARYPNIFSELFTSMLKVGEEAGTMEDVLETLTQQMDREHRLKSQIMGAMMYPMVIISAMLGIGLLMLAIVVPKLAVTFEELHVELPYTTQVIIFLGAFLTEKWYLFIAIVIALAVFLKIGLKSKKGSKIFDMILLKIPIISPIVRKINSAYTVRTLSSLIASGVPIVRALEIVSKTLSNFYFREVITEAAERIKKGAKLADVLDAHQDIYPTLVIQMIRVGEETGETSNILAQLADFFEEEVARTTKNMASIIEPIIMLMIGGAVGFFAVSMIQPMYSMLGAM